MEHLFADSIIKSYGSLNVLTDVYLQCSPGEIIGLIGRNGCGKSTLLKIIFGSISAQQKFLKINNTQILSMKQAAKNMRYLPQDNFLPKNLGITKVIKLYGNTIDIERFKSNPMISKIIKHSPNRLSAGEKRIVEILLILYSKKQYLLLDEPFNGIAPRIKEEIKALIKEMSKTKGLIITDHDYRNVIEISDRLLNLHNGVLRGLDNKEELIYYGYMSK